MAQQVVGLVKLQIPAGKATPAPPVGSALGPHGINIMGFALVSPYRPVADRKRNGGIYGKG